MSWRAIRDLACKARQIHPLTPLAGLLEYPHKDTQAKIQSLPFWFCFVTFRADRDVTIQNEQGRKYERFANQSGVLVSRFHVTGYPYNAMLSEHRFTDLDNTVSIRHFLRLLGDQSRRQKMIHLQKSGTSKTGTAFIVDLSLQCRCRTWRPGRIRRNRVLRRPAERGVERLVNLSQRLRRP